MTKKTLNHWLGFRKYGRTLMDVKDFSKYLEHGSFDELLHHARRTSLERTAENDFPARIFQQEQNQQEIKTAVNQ